jgi:hypothetical protein
MILPTKSFHKTRLLSFRNLQKETLKGTILRTLSTVALFLLTRLYRTGYWCWKEMLPSYQSFQNLICFPLFKWNVPWLRKISLALIRPAQKCESSGFLSTLSIIWFVRYLFHKIVCHNSSSLISLKSHLINKHWF